MGDLFEFPKSWKAPFVETPFVREVVRTTLNTHGDCGLQVWTGRSGVGKTRTARFIHEGLNSRYDPANHDAFKTHYYEVGGGSRLPRQCTMRHGIRSLYVATVGALDERVWRRDPEEEVATRLVRALRMRNLQMVFVDEAGLLSLEEIRGMVLVRDVAEALDWPLSLVLIGMDDMPRTVEKLPQIKRRIHAWRFFQPFDVDATWDVLARLVPHFARESRDCVEHREQVEFIHKLFDGLVGGMIPFVRRLLRRVSERPDLGIDMVLLKAVWDDMRQGRADFGGFEPS